MVSKLSLDIKKQIEKGILVLRQGGLVAYPTDTVYGLGACAWIDRAIEKVYKVKGRSYNMPLPLLLSDISQITDVAESVSPIAWSLIHAFLPGALTLVLLKSGNIPDIVSGGGPTVAVRIPDHPVPIALIEGLGAPIVGTSANLSGKPSSLTADEVYSQIGDSIDFIIDGGQCPGGIESTIVDMTSKTPIILREGKIPKEELEKVWEVLPSGEEKR